jgi:hypothetical protein
VGAERGDATAPTAGGERRAEGAHRAAAVLSTRCCAARARSRPQAAAWQRRAREGRAQSERQSRSAPSAAVSARSRAAPQRPAFTPLISASLSPICEQHSRCAALRVRWRAARALCLRSRRPARLAAAPRPLRGLCRPVAGSPTCRWTRCMAGRLRPTRSASRCARWTPSSNGAIPSRWSQPTTIPRQCTCVPWLALRWGSRRRRLACLPCGATPALGS